jgi:uncharacterized protein YkwD
MVRLLAALTALLVAALAPAVARPAGHARSLSAGVVVQLNAVRRAHGLAPLRPSAQLAAAAGSHSEEMVGRGYFDHASADGTAFWVRVRRFYPAPRGRRWAVGENLVYAEPYLTAHEAVRVWLGSPSHRRTLLDPRWREVGVAAVHASSAPGLSSGPVTVITADFGIRG